MMSLKPGTITPPSPDTGATASPAVSVCTGLVDVEADYYFLIIKTFFVIIYVI